MAAQSDPTKLGAPLEAQFHAGRAQEWVIQQLIRQIHTATLVRVAAVYPTPGTVGFVDVTPMVQQQTTTGVVIDTAPIYRLPYLRAQGGVSAIILDPVVGDMGLAVFAERDISAVISTREQAAAATNRAYDAGDGLYLGGFLNADPTQWLQFFPTGGLELKSPLVTITGQTVTTGNVSVGTGASGSFTTPTGQTVTVQDGIITNIY